MSGDGVLLYTREVEDAQDGTLEQEIAYYHSEEMWDWAGTAGAVEWIRGSILESLKWKKDDNDDGTDDEVQTSCLTKKYFSEREEELAMAKRKLKKWQ